VATALQLSNITTQHIRAEEIKNKKFDFAVSRAVAPLKDLWKWSKPLLKKKEQAEVQSQPQRGLICLKGGDLSQEIHDSGLRPRMIEIEEIFPEPYFKEKYLLHIAL